MILKKVFTLIFIRKDDQILLGLKKRGFGQDKWNGFGGKLEPNESIKEAAVRELREESCLCVKTEDLKNIGHLEFTFEGDSIMMDVRVFSSRVFSGAPKETEEMVPQWFNCDMIPFDKMWPDDSYWFPYMLTDKLFYGRFHYQGYNKISNYDIEELQSMESFYASRKITEDAINVQRRENEMISLTPYTFQPATCRIVKLWRNAKAISDWLTISVSSVCCPCCDTMSLTGSTCTYISEKSVDKQSQLLSIPVVDAGRGTGEPFQPHHVVIDFSPRPEDTDEVQERCLEFLKLINNTPNVKQMCPTRIDEIIPEESSFSSIRSKENIVPNEKTDDFPAIHAVRQLEANGAVKAAFETSVVTT